MLLHRYLSLLPFLFPGALSAQTSSVTPEPAGWFPATFAVQPLSGAQTGVDIATGPIIARRESPAGSDEASPEADVAFGYRIPVYRFSRGVDGKPTVDLGLEGGILARFALGQGRNGLINSDFRVAFPFGADFGDWEARFSLVHVSSHIGDDFIDQTPTVNPGTSSRNGIETDLLYRVDSNVRLAAGLDYNWTAVGVESVGGRFGFVFDPAARARDRIRPVGRFGIHVTDYTTGPTITGAVGAALPTRGGELRLELVGRAGPSEMGQFRAFDEEYVGLFLGFVPSIVVRSGAEELAEP